MGKQALRGRDSPIFNPDLESGSLLATLPKFVRNCRLLCMAIQAQIEPGIACLTHYNCQTGNGFWKIGGLSDRPSRRMSGPCGPCESNLQEHYCTALAAQKAFRRLDPVCLSLRILFPSGTLQFHWSRSCRDEVACRSLSPSSS